MVVFFLQFCLSFCAERFVDDMVNEYFLPYLNAGEHPTVVFDCACVLGINFCWFSVLFFCCLST